jgi:outer membrane receptor protein involved in Fe transport
MKIITRYLYLTILFVIASSATLLAQYPQGGGIGKRPSGGNMNMGHFYGKVVDANTNKPLESATIQLAHSQFDTATKQKKEVVVAALLTDKKGEFSIDKLPIFGNYQITVSSIGHEAYNQPIAFNLKAGGGTDMLSAIDKDLGNIKLQPQAKELAGVVVTAKPPLMQMNIDRKVFNVSQSLTSVGGTAEDVMRNVPSVNVDIDGNVTLRNKTPQIFVDGRPTTLTLDEIPADEIETIEIITNPSAKFDASGGGAGILNIVMKKNRKPGYNGSVRGGADSKGGTNLGGNINMRQGKINVFATGNYFHFISKGAYTNNRVDNVNDTKSILFQDGDQNRNGRMYSGTLGFDYFIDNRNTLTFSGGARNGKFGNTQLLDITTDTLLGSDIKQNTGVNNSKGNFTWNNYNGKISFRHNFAKPNKYITADANYDKSHNTNYNDVFLQYYDADNNPSSPAQNARTTGDGINSNFTFQTDYTNPITDKMKLEAGLRGNVRVSNSNNQNYVLDSTSGKYVNIEALNSNYKYNDQVYAGYVTFSQKLNNFTYQLGGRVESSEYRGELVDSNQTFHNSYPLSFFPSVFLTQKLSANQDLQLNYSRKINRPNFFQIIPYYDFSNPLNISVGNPNLVPEFTNLVELAYNLNLKNGNNIIATVYYRGTTNLISQYQYWGENPNPASNDSVFITTYQNASSSQAYGLEVTSMNKIASWWTITSNINLYNSEIDGSNLEQNLSNQKVSWFGKINNTFSLPKSISLQVSGDYTSKTILPPGRGGGGGNHWGGGNLATANGYIMPTGGVDAAVKKDFLKDKTLSVSLSMNDIFRTRTSKTHSESYVSKGISSVQDVERQMNPQQLRLNASWRFGKADFSLFKRKNMSDSGSPVDMPPVAQ